MFLSMETSVYVMPHDTCGLSIPESESFAYLQDNLTKLMGQDHSVTHQYNEMVWRLQEFQNTLCGLLKHVYEIEKVNLKLVKQLKQTINVNNGTNEQDREVNQDSALNLKLVKQLKQTINVNNGTNEQDREVNQDSALLHANIPCQRVFNVSFNQSPVHPLHERGGQVIVCAGCLKSPSQRSILSAPLNSMPDICQPFSLHSSAKEMLSLDKEQYNCGCLKTLTTEPKNNEPHQSKDFTAGLSMSNQRNTLPNTFSETMSKSLYEWPVSCADFVAGSPQNDVLPNFCFSESCLVSVPSSDKHAVQPGYAEIRERSFKPTVNLNSMPEFDTGLLPLFDDTLNKCAGLDGANARCCEKFAHDPTWSTLPLPSLTDGWNLMQRKASRQCSSFFSHQSLPLCQCKPLINEVYKSFTINADNGANHRTEQQGYLTDTPSQTLRDKFCNETDQFALNFPKCISVRADYNTPKLNFPNYGESAYVLPSIGYNKGCGHHHLGAPAESKVHEQTKLVALAGNLACLAFPQGTYKTEMCNKWLRSMGQFCPYGSKCQFAHGSHELRPVLRHRRYKTNLCRMVAAGEPCPYEHRCHFRHVLYPHEVHINLNAMMESTFNNLTS